MSFTQINHNRKS